MGRGRATHLERLERDRLHLGEALLHFRVRLLELRLLLLVCAAHGVQAITSGSLGLRTADSEEGDGGEDVGEEHG